MNNCIVLGGGGFIGSHLVDTLVSQKYNVLVLTRNNPHDLKNLSLSRNKIKIITGDFCNTDLLNDIIKPNSFVFNLISTSIPSTLTYDVIRSIEPQVKLIEICSQKKIKKLIFASSGGGVYGDKQKLPITEKSLPHPASPHAIGKITIEYYLNYYNKINNLPYLIYRFSNPYGPRQIPKTGFGLIPTLFSHILNNTTPTLYDYGNAVRDFIYIQDLVHAVSISFYEHNQYNVYNIGSGKGVKIMDIWKNIAKITQTNINPSLKPRRKFDVKRYYLNSNRFFTEYDYKPMTNLYNGLKETWNWIISETNH